MKIMKNELTKIVGIDYSLTCPAICQYNGQAFEDCNFAYITNKKKYEGNFGNNITGYPMKPYNDPVERFTHLSTFILKNLPENAVCFIEGYSFGSKGRALFQIAENGGILKYRLKYQGVQGKRIEFDIIPPANIKKFATQKGNADKAMMYDKFYEETGVNLMEKLDQQTLASPVTDMVDAYYIAKYGFVSLSIEGKVQAKIESTKGK